jgi:hypothetical protein
MKLLDRLKEKGLFCFFSDLKTAKDSCKLNGETSPLFYIRFVKTLTF